MRLPTAMLEACSTSVRMVVVQMRLSRAAGALAAITIAATGCMTTVHGAAVVPPGTDPTSDVALTEDGFGIQLGKSFAPTQVTLYTEPQCPHCARLQEDYGAAMANYIDDGQLAVTYRFVTFLDESADGYSAQASNAVFLAANPGADLPAATIQNFIWELYLVMDLFGPAAEEIPAIASNTGIPPKVIDHVEAGDTGVDVEAMDEANQASLDEIRPGDAGTPTVFDTTTEEVVDTSDPEWLDQLVESN